MDILAVFHAVHLLEIDKGLLDGALYFDTCIHNHGSCNGYGISYILYIMEVHTFLCLMIYKGF